MLSLSKKNNVNFNKWKTKDLRHRHIKIIDSEQSEKGFLTSIFLKKKKVLIKTIEERLKLGGTDCITPYKKL